jgi:hypothetical protein
MNARIAIKKSNIFIILINHATQQAGRHGALIGFVPHTTVGKSQTSANRLQPPTGLPHNDVQTPGRRLKTVGTKTGVKPQKLKLVFY